MCVRARACASKQASADADTLLRAKNSLGSTRLGSTPTLTKIYDPDGKIETCVFLRNFVLGRRWEEGKIKSNERFRLFLCDVLSLKGDSQSFRTKKGKIY